MKFYSKISVMLFVTIVLFLCTENLIAQQECLPFTKKPAGNIHTGAELSQSIQ